MLKEGSKPMQETVIIEVMCESAKIPRSLFFHSLSSFLSFFKPLFSRLRDIIVFCAPWKLGPTSSYLSRLIHRRARAHTHTRAHTLAIVCFLFCSSFFTRAVGFFRGNIMCQVYGARSFWRPRETGTFRGLAVSVGQLVPNSVPRR